MKSVKNSAAGSEADCDSDHNLGSVVQSPIKLILDYSEHKLQFIYWFKNVSKRFSVFNFDLDSCFPPA